MSIKFSQFIPLPTVDSNVIVPVVSEIASISTSFKTTIGDIQSFVLTGNAATASQFETARTINGVEFNGTANIRRQVLH